MKTQKNTFAILAVIAAVATPSLQAQRFLTWVGGDGDFYAQSNWDPAATPSTDDVVAVDNGGAATIADDAGDRELAWLLLGETQGSSESGHIVMNGGFLRIGIVPSDEKVRIGEGTVQSSFVMNGGTIYFDGPDDPALAGSSSAAGINEVDWEVGEHGVGRFEMHGDAEFRAGDDLKIAENAAGTGSCLIDGDARLSVGSGIAISNGGENEQVMVIAGNAVVEAGNSMGAGNPDGHTDEGYLTLSIGGGRANLTVQDSAILNFRVLSSREGVTLFTVKDQGQVHIFDVLTGRGFIDDQTPPDRPEIVGGFRNSLSSGPETESTLTLQDNARMTVNASEGLGISGPRGTSDPGGKATLVVRDAAAFRVEQYLALGTGNQAATSDGTLEIRGPDAIVSIGGNLNLAVDPDGVVPTTDLVDDEGNPVPGKATLNTVITGPTHATIEVEGIARIAQGILKVTLDDYTPAGGEVFTLIQGGTVEGEFRETDYTEAPLADGLSWELDYAADAVRLQVAGGPIETSLSIALSGNEITLSWDGGGNLERANVVTGPWSVVPNASSPYTTQATDSAAFFRVR